MNGILLIDKPAGWTSFDVVAKVRGVLKQGGVPKPKVGHTGTLDPLATGLLVIVAGSYTKRAQEFSKLDKVYEVTMRLGQTSTTGDDEGEKTKSKEQRAVGSEELEQAFKGFEGETKQVPPIYSAIKVNGQRAYKLARAGKEVRLEPRAVIIHSLRLTHYSYPTVEFTAEVSSGTYIRSLVSDIGETLGTGAYMADLRRTKVGEFPLESSLAIEQLTPALIEQSLLT